MHVRRPVHQGHCALIRTDIKIHQYSYEMDTLLCHTMTRSVRPATQMPLARGDSGTQFNAELVACVRRAWLEAVRALLQLEVRGVYDLLPPAGDLQAAPHSLGFLLAQKARNWQPIATVPGQRRGNRSISED